MYASAACGVYPRACGGTQQNVVVGRRHTSTVYPRACGGTSVRASDVIVRPLKGLSPRLRGNRLGLCVLGSVAWSIPAPAGEPFGSTASPATPTVYPRACGGTRLSTSLPMLGLGLSPRLRGNQFFQPFPGDSIRSIPAPAGEPVPLSPSSRAGRVYPRACGGTNCRITVKCLAHGLSPRLRGNHRHIPEIVHAGGSIPAPAGEPSTVPRFRNLDTVYPRACGGTLYVERWTTLVGGLSPRLRGNPRRQEADRHVDRSIPAPAGEPTKCGR